MYYKLINDNTKYEINDIKELDKLKNKEFVIELIISFDNLNELPECINDFPNLQELWCNNNKLTTLRELKLPNLQILDCSYNKLTTLGELNLPNLQKLDCRYNKLTTLGQFNLPNLQELDCRYNKLTTLVELNLPNLQLLYCSNNQLTTLGTLNLPNLQRLYCINNQLTTLCELNLPNLQHLYCYNNQLTTLEELNLPNLQMLDCSDNKLTTLGHLNLPILQKLLCYNNELTTLGQLNLPNLLDLYCYNNKLKTLGELNLPNLQILDCSHNNLTTLGQLNLPNLQQLDCRRNQLTTLPLTLMNTILNYINYANNEIDNLPLTLIRFINNIRQGNLNRINLYNDTQNIHNSSIQLTVKESINRLSEKFRLVKFNLEDLTNQILEDKVINCKERLIQYMSNKEEHSLLLLNFAEILWLVWQVINEFEPETQIEIKKRLNEEIQEAECMCYTGRCNRLINCLNGFSDLVEIKIQDSSQIGNVIVIVKERLEDNNEYTIDKHKEEVKKELLERGYELETINEWIEYIQEE
jgi:Leucine-rich repeat (LRR) protein